MQRFGNRSVMGRKLEYQSLPPVAASRMMHAMPASRGVLERGWLALSVGSIAFRIADFVEEKTLLKRRLGFCQETLGEERRVGASYRLLAVRVLRST
jgi:hypothetical protein